MKILFFDKNSISKGSTRIWIHNLYHWMQYLGYDVYLNNHVLNNIDVIIFGKSSSYKTILTIKNKYPKIKVGIINPSDITQEKRNILKICDFYITGSIEERDWYLKYNKNVFILPLIETLFHKYKTHKEKKEIILSYHGNKQHLEQFYPNITKAINTVAKNINLKLLAIYDIKTLGKWKIGRPDIEIEDIQWDINTIEQELLRSDIGLVPGLNPITENYRKLFIKILKFINPLQARFNNDYLIEFKNTTNAGRTFVYHQLGIPVISDFIPSSFHILGDESNGFIAHSKEGWIRALEILSSSAEIRTNIANNAKEIFDTYYNPKQWTIKLYNDILKIIQE